jgi:AcrR family transcriptional regulator
MVMAAIERDTGEDRRVRRTRRALAEALIALTQERDFAAVTVRAIAARAEVGYATFFRHYSDKEALLAEVLDVVIDEVIALLHPDLAAATGPGEVAAAEPMPGVAQPQPVTDSELALGTSLFRYARDHAAICRVLLRGPGADLLLERIVARGTALALAEGRRGGGTVPPEIAAHHLVTATLSLLGWWLEHDMPYPPERMGAIYRELIAAPARVGGW